MHIEIAYDPTDPEIMEKAKGIVAAVKKIGMWKGRRAQTYRGSELFDMLTANGYKFSLSGNQFLIQEECAAWSYAKNLAERMLDEEFD
jgi:hypothetical protein